MKLTKRQLTRIIKEELEEGFFGGGDPADALEHLKKALSILEKKAGHPEAVDGIVTAIEALEYPEFGA